MSLIKELKNLKNIKNELAQFAISQLFEYNSYSLFDDKEEISESIDISKKYLGCPWNYYRYKDTKEEIQDYWDKIDEIQKNKGSEGYAEFKKNVEEYYDPNVYKEHSLELEKTKKILEDIGFTVEVNYSKDPENFTLENTPERMFLRISY